MKKIAIVGWLMICCTGAFAQSSCGIDWLRDQVSNGLTKPPWDEYIGPRVRKLNKSSVFPLASDTDQRVSVELTAGRHYTILYYTGTEALASGLELRDVTGLRVAFDKVYGKAVNNWLEAAYDAQRTATYTVTVRSVFPADGSSCAAVLVREYDDQEWRERQRDNPIE